MTKDEKCCGTCKWHQRYPEGCDYWCLNPESDYYTEFTGYDDVCDDWEERE